MEFNQVLDWRAGPGVCRCCLSEGCYKDISTEYFWMGEKEIYAEMLLECYSLTISYQEGRPNSNSRLICEVCITRLRDAANFKKQVINSERNFAKHLIEVPVEREVEVTYTPTESLPIQQVKDESRVSDDGDFDDSQFDANFDCDDDADDQPLKNFATNVLKREDTVPDVTVEKVKTKDGKSPSKRKAAAKKGGVSPAKKAKAMKQEKEAKPSSSKPPKTERKKGRRSRVSDEQEATSADVECDSERLQRAMMKHNLTTILVNSTACPFRWLHSTFMCFYCDTKFGDMDSLKNHTESNHGNTEEAFKRHRWCYRHIKVEISELKCRLCHATLKGIEDVKEHLVAAHDKTIEVNYSDGVIPYFLCSGSFSCHICRKVFYRFRLLSNHLNEHYRNYVCDICGAPFLERDRLRQHLLTHGGGSFSCHQCDKVFESIIGKRHHVARVHLNDGFRLTCPHCPERFKEYRDRIHHMAAIHDVKNQNCGCPSCLRPSKEISTTVKRFQCNECSKKFTRRHELACHRVCHTGEKPFTCEVCSKSYGRRRTLREHMRIHNDDRRFACPECGRTFVQKITLKSHLRVHFVHSMN